MFLSLDGLEHDSMSARNEDSGDISAGRGLTVGEWAFRGGSSIVVAVVS